MVHIVLCIFFYLFIKCLYYKYKELCNSMFPDSFNLSLMYPTLDQIRLFLFNHDITAIQNWVFLKSSTNLYLLPHLCLHNPTQHCYALDTSIFYDTDHTSVAIGLKLTTDDTCWVCHCIVLALREYIVWTSACQVPFETKERNLLEDNCFAIFSYLGSSVVRSSQRLYDNVNNATAMHVTARLLGVKLNLKISNHH